jgi:phage terminase small subunit
MLGEFQRKPTARQRRFVEEYLLRDDARAAAIAAGYSPDSADQRGRCLLRVPWVADAIRHKLDARAERTRIDADRVVEELARIAFSDLGRMVEWGPEGLVPRPPSQLAAADRAAIARIARRGDTMQIVLHDKIRALDALGKYFKLWGRHAEKFGRAGDVPYGANIRDEPQAQARARLQVRIEAIIGEREAGERDLQRREEEAWAREWARAFGD